MFKGDTTSQGNNGNEICRISKGTKITGTLTSTSDIRIDGIFEGTIHTNGKLVIGESSKIKGKVYSQNCDMWGHVEGDIFIGDVINMKNKSSLTGSLKAPQIGIEIGAVFNGQCNIITSEEYNKYLQEEIKGNKSLETMNKAVRHEKAVSADSDK